MLNSLSKKKKKKANCSENMRDSSESCDLLVENWVGIAMMPLGLL